MQKRYRSDSQPFTADVKTPFQKCAQIAVIGQGITCIKSARVTIRNVRRISIQPLTAPPKCTTTPTRQPIS